MNTRRKLIIAFGACVLATPLGSFAQQPSARIPRIGFLGSTSAAGYARRWEAFQTGLLDLGYVEGKNLMIERRFADNRVERLPNLAAELVQLKVDVIVTAATPATRAAQKATTMIPIVFVSVTDPVELGLVKTLARPGGNITGLSNLSDDITPKHLEMMLSMVPKLSRLAVLVNPANPSHALVLKRFQSAAQRTRVKILPMEAQTPQEIGNAFSKMTKENSEAVIVVLDPFFNQQHRQIAELAARNRLPSISGQREYVEAGFLISYGQNLDDPYRRTATYVDKILKGAKPGDLPVEQPAKFEMLINGKTAKALGLTIPQELLLRADKVIE